MVGCMGRSSVLPRKRIPVSQDNRHHPNRMAYTDEYEEALLQIREDMEDMTYDEKMEFCRVRAIHGIRGFQDAMLSLEEMMTLQEERIEELQTTVKRETFREASLHTVMLLVCILFYIYGSFFGLYMCRK